jgi:hypothetical protein
MRIACWKMEMKYMEKHGGAIAYEGFVHLEKQPISRS